MENPERHTVYLVISLFVNFLRLSLRNLTPLKIDPDFSNKHSTPTDEKANAKKQSLLFRLFNTLLGYSNTEKCFTIPPARLRYSNLVYTSSRLFFCLESPLFAMRFSVDFRKFLISILSLEISSFPQSYNS